MDSWSLVLVILVIIQLAHVTLTRTRNSQGVKLRRSSCGRGRLPSDVRRPHGHLIFDPHQTAGDDLGPFAVGRTRLTERNFGRLPRRRRPLGDLSRESLIP
jgi:hypothetical protein